MFVLSDGINFDNVLNPNFLKMISPEFVTSLIVMLAIIIFSLVVYFKQKNLDPLEKPKGIVNIAEFIVEFGDRQVSGLPEVFFKLWRLCDSVGFVYLLRILHRYDGYS